jgi:hypothetical protein
MRALTTSATLALAAALLLSAASLADLGSEVAQGQQIANSLRSGQRDCTQLSVGELELIGEYAMDSYLRNRQSHEAMNQHMVQLMGEAGERRMHQALGARFAGCPGASSNGWTGAMAAMMGAYGHGYSGMGPGMMNARRQLRARRLRLTHARPRRRHQRLGRRRDRPWGGVDRRAIGRRDPPSPPAKWSGSRQLAARSTL